ncbi:MAG: 23S rRNA (pseudouridine(1915)-N(3))-methyltransferase RlmH [Bacteroidetes bacterium]|nr:23S rRNA (pseudouridine(1915)-N(3))-methyltransferase RlmH [Bacteroidota bacterium]
MKIKFLVIGKTDTDYLKKGIDEYIKRLKHYVPFEMIVIPDLKNTKNLTEDIQKQKEGELILNQLDRADFLVLLDENGKKYSSVNFSQFIEKKMIAGLKTLIFVVGGPYGFSREVYQKANTKISLSDMTFSHQMVRLIFVEQLYRAMTIIRGEPYHHK